MATSRGKRQIAKLTKKQLGFEIGRNVLNQISLLANGVRDIIEKGRAADPRTGQPKTIECSPQDIKRSWSTEQLVGVEDFVSNWSTEPEPEPKPQKKKKPVK